MKATDKNKGFRCEDGKHLRMRGGLLSWTEEYAGGPNCCRSRESWSSRRWDLNLRLMHQLGKGISEHSQAPVNVVLSGTHA